MDFLSKYLEDKNFIHWVFEPDPDLEDCWNRFQTDHPDEKNNVLLARRVLLKFRTNDKKLTEEEKILLFSKVLQKIEEKQRHRKSTQLIISLMKYAAVALLFFLIGAMMFYRQDQFNPQFYSQKLTEPIPENSAKLIRSNQEDLYLKDDKPVLHYGSDGKLVINHDTITEDPSKTTDAMNQLIIPYGKSSEVTLSDGTKVYLNAGSRLVYPEFFKGKTREVFLLGEAFFDVKHDKDHPFIVQLNDLRVKVLGTRFNLSAYASDRIVETVLEEGKVSIKRNTEGFFDEATELVPNQLASFDRTTKEINVQKVNVDNYILWKQGILKFEHTDLNRIIKKLERFYNIRIFFRDPLLGGLGISGKLELKEDKDEIFDRIARAASVRIIKKDVGIYEIIK